MDLFTLGPLSSVRGVKMLLRNFAFGSAIFLSPPQDVLTVHGTVDIQLLSATSTLNNFTLASVRVLESEVKVGVFGGAVLGTFNLLGPLNAVFDIFGNMAILVQGYSSILNRQSTISNLLVDNIRTMHGTVNITTVGGIIGLCRLRAKASSAESIQIMGDLVVDSTNGIRNVAVGPLSRIGGSLRLQDNLDGVVINTLEGPSLTVDGNVEIGTLNPATVMGPVTVHNLALVGQSMNIVINTDLTSSGDLIVRGPPGELLTIVDDLTIRLHRQRTNRRIAFTNMGTVQGFTSVYQDYQDVSISPKPISINGRLVNRIDRGQFDNITRDLNDPGCINACNGRGLEPTTDTVACDRLVELSTPCECWPGYSGPLCEQACGVGATNCLCICSAWSPWRIVQDHAQIRNRTCAEEDSVCLRVELRGTINCQTTEYEAVPATPTSHRICAVVKTCQAVGIEYEVSAPTAFKDRVCGPVSSCQVGTEYRTADPTATTDRICATLTTCEPGSTVEVIAPSEDSDRVCRSCDPSTNECDCASCSQGEYIMQEVCKPGVCTSLQSLGVNGADG